MKKMMRFGVPVVAAPDLAAAIPVRPGTRLEASVAIDHCLEISEAKNESSFPDRCLRHPIYCIRSEKSPNRTTLLQILPIPENK
jgi:hypothetical protein